MQINVDINVWAERQSWSWVLLTFYQYDAFEQKNNEKYLCCCCCCSELIEPAPLFLWSIISPILFIPIVVFFFSRSPRLVSNRIYSLCVSAQENDNNYTDNCIMLDRLYWIPLSIDERPYVNKTAKQQNTEFHLKRLFMFVFFCAAKRPIRICYSFKPIYKCIGNLIFVQACSEKRDNRYEQTWKSILLVRRNCEYRKTIYVECECVYSIGGESFRRPNVIL